MSRPRGWEEGASTVRVCLVALVVAALAWGCDGGGGHDDDEPGPDAACSRPADCQSGFCVDGVCCNEACAGACESCAVAGAEGTCRPVPSGSDPRDQCDPDAVATCGRDGACDGAGECRRYGAGTVCREPSCSGTSYELAGTCDGAGACRESGVFACDPFVCDPSGTACRTDCALADDCVPPASCTGGRCGKRSPGQACSADGECDSGVCAHGVCCTTACTGACRSCALPGSAGLCLNVPAGADPLGDCADQGAASCGTNGACNGAGECARYGAGTVCAEPSCVGSTATSGGVCDGRGVCQPALVFGCEPYQCADTACASRCSDDGDCVPPAHCVEGSCGPKPLGDSCASAVDCASGFCTDGVCCNADCRDRCTSCALPASLGVCGNVPAGEDPHDDCVDRGGGSCATDGTCDGAGACRLFPAGTVCSGQSCEDAIAIGEGTCDGAGTCRPGEATACGAYVCDGTDCATHCATNNDCNPPAVCTGGRCGLKPEGTPCRDGAECASSACAQGVCCATPCTGICRSCALPSSLGACAPVPAAQDPLDQCEDQGVSGCGTDGTCDGDGACARYADGSLCGPASCVDAALQPAATCEGGVCTPPAAVSCAPFTCADGACRFDCETSADCQGAQCVNGRCVVGPPGTPCAADDECDSGFCEQGVCCVTVCQGLCRSCALPASAGTCADVPAGQDPRDQCADQGPASCGTDGSCAGDGACRLYADGTQCGPDLVCSNDLRAATAGGVCKDGACTPPTTVTCTPYICVDGKECLHSCDSPADCVTGFMCNEQHECTLPSPGVPCAGRALALIANTGTVIVNSGVLVDSYRSAAGPYGGSNVGDAGNVQAGASVINNGGVVHGTVTANTPAGLVVVPPPPGATNLPLGSATPGTLAINNAAESVTLAPGSYVVQNLYLNAPGTLAVAGPGRVRIWVTGALNLGGNGNPQGLPVQLQLLVTSSQSVNVNSGGMFIGLVYAPTSQINLNGPIFGSVTGGSGVNLNSGAAVHFDESASCPSRR